MGHAAWMGGNRNAYRVPVSIYYTNITETYNLYNSQCGPETLGVSSKNLEWERVNN
jgi:hypothetical protein